IPAGRQGDNSRRRLEMPGRVTHVFDPLAVQVANIVVCMLIPSRSAVAALILIISLRNPAGEDLQHTHGSLALMARGIRPDGRKNDRRRRATAKPQNHRAYRKESDTFHNLFLPFAGEVVGTGLPG